MSAPTSARFSIQLYASVPAGPVNWRLLSGNNRECGRGSGLFRDADHCLDVLARMQADIGLAALRNRRADANRWLWEIEMGGRCVAVAGRSVDRLVRCDQAARQFLAEFGDAPVRPGLAVSGARRWGSVA